MQRIKELLEAKGLPQTLVAAVMGNIDVETGGSFSHKQKQRRASKKAHGLFQFDPQGMLPPYRAWLKKEKLKDTPEAQVSFFHSTLYGDNVDALGATKARRMREFLASADVPTATEYLAREWFQAGKPMMDKRLASADKFFYPDENPNEIARFAREASPSVSEAPPSEPVEESFMNKLLYKIKDIF